MLRIASSPRAVFKSPDVLTQNDLQAKYPEAEPKHAAASNIDRSWDIGRGRLLNRGRQRVGSLLQPVTEIRSRSTDAMSARRLTEERYRAGQPPVRLRCSVDARRRPPEDLRFPKRTGHQRGSSR